MKPQTSTRKARGTRFSARFAALAAVLAAFAVPASAQAITVSGTAAPTDPAAGAHSDINIHMDFSGGQVKDLTVGLPPGVVGDPNATPLCTAAQLNASTGTTDGCPANTQVGAVSAQAQLVLPVPLAPVTVNGRLYNLAPQPGEPARFGIVLHPDPLGVTDPIILQSAVKLRPDFGLDSVITGIPNTTLLPGDTTIISQDITLFGIAPGTGKPFMRNPTSCGLATTRFTAVPHSGSAGTGQASFTPTGCGALPFSPTFSAKVTVPGRFTGGQKVALSTTIAQGVGEAGLRDAVVRVPSDFAADVNQITGGELCPLPSFQAGACPAVSVVGSATSTSPLLTQALSGPVIAIETPGGGIPMIGLDLTGQLSLRLTGSLAIDNTTTFAGLPDIPISTFELRFNGGPDGLLMAKRDVCKPPVPVFNTAFTSHSGVALAGATPAVVEGCVPCPVKKGKKKKAKKKRKQGKKSAAVVAKKKKKKGKKKKGACKPKKKKKKKKKGKKRR